MADYRVIGTPVERVDGFEMLSGQALYGPDVRLPGMLWGKILRSPVPHAKVLRVDVEKAKHIPGVRTVITARDVPDCRYSYAVEDENIFAIAKVRYIGEPVAAVAAVDEEAGEEALSLIEVDSGSNIIHQASHQRGDVEAGLQKADCRRSTPARGSLWGQRNRRAGGGRYCPRYRERDL